MLVGLYCALHLNRAGFSTRFEMFATVVVGFSRRFKSTIINSTNYCKPITTILCGSSHWLIVLITSRMQDTYIQYCSIYNYIISIITLLIAQLHYYLYITTLNISTINNRVVKSRS